MLWLSPVYRSPQLDNGYWYYYRYVGGGEYPIHCRKAKTLDAPEEVMLDVNVLAKDFDYFSAAGLDVSTDYQILASAEDTRESLLAACRIANSRSASTSGNRTSLRACGSRIEGHPGRKAVAGRRGGP